MKWYLQGRAAFRFRRTIDACHRVDIAVLCQDNTQH